jgi:DNA-directed RNA polymerase subunit beta
VTAGARVARKRRVSVFLLLRAIGYDPENFDGFLERFVSHFKQQDGDTDLLREQFEKDSESFYKELEKERLKNQNKHLELK